MIKDKLNIDCIESELMRIKQNLDGMNEIFMQVDYFIKEALFTDGAHHKQYYIEKIAKALGIEIEGLPYEEGIAP